jgi:aspartyl/asparaginyl beta-hydroxylase (cupin superfamily)
MALSVSPAGVLLLGLVVAAAAFVHFRGRVRDSISRQLFDHSTLLAPFNLPLYLFAKVPGRHSMIPGPSRSSPYCATTGGRSATRTCKLRRARREAADRVSALRGTLTARDGPR